MASIVELGTEVMDWQIGKSLNQCLGHMLDKSIQTDVTFKCNSKDGDEVEISAHKLILGARSPVFAAMFDGRFREASEPVEITDIEPAPFKDMLRYIYTDDVDLNGASVLQTLYAAKKYMLQGLQDKCREYLVKYMEDDIVCDILSHGLNYEDDALVQKCLEYAGPRAKHIIDTNAFKRMSQPALLKFLGNDMLHSGMEDDVFIAALKWAKSKVDDPENPEIGEMRSLLGDCIFQIRYGAMDVKTFANVVSDFDVLSGDEKILFFSLLVTGNTRYRDSLADKGFNVRTRWLYSGNVCGTSLMCGQINGNMCTEVFIFSTNKPIIYVGLKIIGSFKGSKYKINVTLTDVSTSQVLSETKGTYIVLDDGNTIDVFADEPVQLYFKTYRVKIDMAGPVMCMFHEHQKYGTTTGGVKIICNMEKSPALVGLATVVNEIIFQTKV